MIYNDTSTNTGILQEIESQVFSSNYGKITGSTALLQTFTRYCNQALDHIVVKILESDDRWQYDDSTYTDLPIGTATLVNAQQDYSLSVNHLKVLGVSIKDSAGNWVKLTQFDPQDLSEDRAEFMKTASVPQYYDVMANSVFLYPAPATGSVTLTAGLKVYFQRPPNYFITSDTAKVAGFPSVFHRLIALWASYFYCQANGMGAKIGAISDEIKKMETELVAYYGNRNVEGGRRLKTAQVLSK
jgi:hypothetical protein